MTPHAIHNDDIKPRHVGILEAAEQWMRSLPDGLSCHDVVARFHETWPRLGRPVRGWWFNRAYEHSWIEFDDDQVVLDLYPWAQTRPVLVTVRYGTLRRLYTEEEPGDADARAEEYISRCEQLRHVHEVLKRHDVTFAHLLESVKECGCDLDVGFVCFECCLREAVYAMRRLCPDNGVNGSSTGGEEINDDRRDPEEASRGDAGREGAGE